MCCCPQIDPKLVEALLPSIAVLDPTWVNKVVPAVVRAFDADYLVRLVRTIAPGLSKVNPDLLVALLPMVNTISLETWQKLIELLNKITIQQVGTEQAGPCSRQHTVGNSSSSSSCSGSDSASYQQRLPKHQGNACRAASQRHTVAGTFRTGASCMRSRELMCCWKNPSGRLGCCEPVQRSALTTTAPQGSRLDATPQLLPQHPNAAALNTPLPACLPAMCAAGAAASPAGCDGSRPG